MEPELDSVDQSISFIPNTENNDKNNFEIAQDDKMTMKTNNAYHEQGLAQAKISFYYSLVGGAVGFIILIASVFYLKEKQSYVGIISGIIIDAVSAIFFNIANNASKARTAYFDKLRDDTKHKDALVLCQSIEDAKIKDNLRVKLSLYFAGIDESKICQKTNETCYTDSKIS